LIKLPTIMSPPPGRWMARAARALLSPVNSPRTGLMMSLTREVVMELKAPPMTTPTARSMTLPRMAKALNSRKNFFMLSYVLRSRLPVGGLLLRRLLSGGLLRRGALRLRFGGDLGGSLVLGRHGGGGVVVHQQVVGKEVGLLVHLHRGDVQAQGQADGLALALGLGLHGGGPQQGGVLALAGLGVLVPGVGGQRGDRGGGAQELPNVFHG